MSDLNHLIKQRASLKSRLTIFEKFLNAKLDSIGSTRELQPNEIIELESKVERQEALLTEFNNIQSEIEMHEESDESQFLERENYENRHDSVLSKARALITENRQADIQTLDSDSESNKSNKSVKSKSRSVAHSMRSRASSSSAKHQKTNVELPRIKLPVFKGTYEKWPEFRDTFLSLIDKRDDLDAMEKFHYLRLNLEDEAKQIIESLSFCEQNYKVAWNLLVENYENKNLLVYNHLKQLISISAITSPSSVALKNLINQTLKHLNCLKELGLPTDKWDVLIIFLMCEKLDKRTEQAWEDCNKGNILPTLETFKRFIKDKASTLEKIENRDKAQRQSDHSKNIKARGESRAFQKSFAAFEVKCGYCKGQHYINHCSDFVKLTTNEKIEYCKNNKMCLNCLKGNHLSKDCRASSCKKCNARHHTLLHFNRSSSADNKSEGTVPQTSAITQSSETTQSNQLVTKCNFIQTHNILLSTALVQVRGCNGKFHNMRVLLDSGSQSNFITEEACNKLGLKKSQIDISVMGISQVISEIKYKCEIQLSSLHNDFNLTITCLVVRKICDQIPSYPVRVESLDIPKNIKLADAGFHTPGNIQILVGAEVFYNLLCIGQITLGKQKPTLQKTLFGWVVSGPVSSSISPSKTVCSFSTVDIQSQLEKFWLLEEPPISNKSIMSKDEEMCETIFQKTTIRDVNGKFVVDLPFRQPPQILGSSREIAMKRFLSLENKLSKNSVLKSMYHDFMKEYLSLGHMVLANESSSNEIHNYLPHHGVLNENSVTTKLRVVFDASCATDRGISLNDILLIGPTIQDDLFTIILRFRQHPIVVCADIEKMYRMVGVNPKHWSLQSIFWRADPTEEIATYNLTTVTYGTASAPFLAVRCLEQLARENANKYPKAANAISHDFYVDDFISGAESVADAIQLTSEVTSILKSGSFNLRKWSSNSHEVMSQIQGENDQPSKVQLGEKSNTKLLGLFWSSENDLLTYSINHDKSQNISKRSILSEISRIFDPLGLLAPCIIQVKLILQKLWTLKVTWDEAIPSTLASQWLQFREQISKLNVIEVPRKVLCDNPANIQLHGFADASQEAYGACVYVRSENTQGQVKVSLLCAKGRVAPLKSQTVNRLELCGAYLLAQLVHKVISSMTCKFDGIYLWTDSCVVLCWINQSPHVLQQFVANRVCRIQELTTVDNWHHVSTHCNPADIISRGVNPNNIRDCSLWWYGPSWLSLNPSEWPTNSIDELNEIPDLKRNAQSFLVTHCSLFPFNRFSNFVRLKRTFAWCRRFIHNCKNPQAKLKGFLSVKELTDSELFLAKISQNESFPSELANLTTNKVGKFSNIQNLNPFIDSHGLLRVGGRLRSGDFSYEKRHPILLSGKHPLSKLLFSHEHKTLFHAGPQHLLSTVRERYWVTSGRSLAKRVVHECIRCQRLKPSHIHPLMGSLPKDRITPTPAFHVTGIDYAGPFQIADKKGRGARLRKCYIALFVCFSTKAIHLELVTDLTSEAFLATLRRFMSRRGKPCDIYSDNGTTFVGAKAELDEFSNFVKQSETELQTTLSNEGINWHFIPAHSPHFGGLWEAGVKSTKFHLKRVLSNVHLTFEYFYTVLVQIEAILNSRPLTPMSSDPNDYDVLTAAHFLIGRRLTSVPDVDYSNVKCNRLSHYQLLQKIQQDFWTRWSKEFISELQVRTKWTKSKGELKRDTLVLIRDDNLPPLKWRLGRIEALHPGPDGVSRVAEIRTANGVIKRSFSKLCPLVLSEN